EPAGPPVTPRPRASSSPSPNPGPAACTCRTARPTPPRQRPTPPRQRPAPPRQRPAPPRRQPTPSRRRNPGEGQSNDPPPRLPHPRRTGHARRPRRCPAPPRSLGSGEHRESARLHGILMVFGFLGTVIALERAVALAKPVGFLAPGLLGLGAIVLLTPAPLIVGQIG